MLDQPDDDTIYIVMEYVGKYSIQKRIEAKKLNRNKIWQYFEDTVNGLEY